MGARWAWYARCTDGHIYSNFSGGADPCYKCEAPPEVEIQCPHIWDETPCDCRASLMPEKEIPQVIPQGKMRDATGRLTEKERTMTTGEEILLSCRGHGDTRVGATTRDMGTHIGMAGCYTCASAAIDEALDEKNEEMYDQIWCHAGCLTIAEGGPVPNKPRDDWSPAMNAVMDLRERAEKAEAEYGELQVSSAREIKRLEAEVERLERQIERLQGHSLRIANLAAERKATIDELVGALGEATILLAGLSVANTYEVSDGKVPAIAPKIAKQIDEWLPKFRAALARAKDNAACQSE